MNGNQEVTEALRRDKRGLQAMLKNWKKNLLWLLMAVSLMLCACGQVEIVIGDGSGYGSSTQNGSQLSGAGNRSQTSVSLDSIPEYSGDPYVVVNNNVPFFSKEDLKAEVLKAMGIWTALEGAQWLIPWWEPRPCQQRSVEASVR